MREKISKDLTIDIDNNIVEYGNRIFSLNNERLTNLLLIEILKKLSK